MQTVVCDVEAGRRSAKKGSAGKRLCYVKISQGCRANRPVDPYLLFIPIIHSSYLACIPLFRINCSKSPESSLNLHQLDTPHHFSNRLSVRKLRGCELERDDIRTISFNSPQVNIRGYASSSSWLGIPVMNPGGG